MDFKNKIEDARTKLTADDVINVVSLLKNSYESLYHNTSGKSPTMATYFGLAVQGAFAIHNLVCDDPLTTNDTYGMVFKQAFSKVVSEVSLSPDKDAVFDLSKGFDSFVVNHDDAYSRFFENFNEQNGHSVDAVTRYNRTVTNYSPERLPGVYYADDQRVTPAIDPEQLSKAYYLDEADAIPEISYSKKVTTAPVPRRRNYSQSKQEEAVAETLKVAGGKYDKQYDDYVRSKPTNESKFTAGDSYGFDEIDDGPGL